MFQTKTIRTILDALARHYPRGAKPWTGGADPFQTTIGTILSAQTTDDQVDRVTPELFRRYPTPAKLANAKTADVESIIKSVGLHQTKARNIIAAARMIVSVFEGCIPKTREELVKLPGVGRKTANVVLIKAFGKPAMPVDTHVLRVTNRIGLASAKTPEKTETQLEAIIPKAKLGAAHFWLIHFGRTICTARNPRCPECPIKKWCRYPKKTEPFFKGSNARTSP